MKLFILIIYFINNRILLTIIEVLKKSVNLTIFAN